MFIIYKQGKNLMGMRRTTVLQIPLQKRTSWH